MKFRETELKGAYIIELERTADERGFFARTWCRREFSDAGILADFVQGNVSFNAMKGTLRGMHYQEEPYGEAKLIRCSRGSLYDVIIDLRPASPTFKRWLPVELSERMQRMLYVPEGFAHGFLTLEDHTEVVYLMSQYYMPAYSRGVRWNDPEFAIRWPQEVSVISVRDAGYPDFAPGRTAGC